MVSRFHRNVAIGICLAGWAVGLPIYMFGGSGDDALPFELTMEAKSNVNRLGRLGGTSALVYQQFGDWLSSLFHGWRLGLTIGVLASLFALAWYQLAPRR